MEKEAIIIDVQVVLYFKDLIRRPDLILPTIQQEFGSVFDQIPIMLPIPSNSNFNDVPVVILNSSNGVYQCNFAQNRIDLFIRAQGKQKFIDLKPSLIDKFHKIYSLIIGETKIKRIAFVSRFFIKESDGSKIVSQLIDKSFKKLHGEKEVSSAQIRYVTKEKWLNMLINNNILLHESQATVQNYINNEKGVLITRDFNTDSEHDYSELFTNDMNSKFIDWAEGCFNIDKIMDLLWPNRHNQLK